MRLAQLVAVLLALAFPAAARSGDPRKDEAYPLQVKVGDAVAICETQTILCPAGAAVCDDPAIARPDGDARGVLFRGVSPGTTLCSAGSSSGQVWRVVYRVTVVAR
jgi:hypothetical protein